MEKVFALMLAALLISSSVGIIANSSKSAGDIIEGQASEGKIVAYKAYLSGLWIMNPDGSNQTQITNDGSEPSWSPDGTKIAYNCDNVICIVKADGSVFADGTNRRSLTSDPGRHPSWSPDGKKIAYTSFAADHYRIYVMSSDGSHQSRLTNQSADFFGPSWSPDSRRIAFFREGPFPSEIYVMNSDGSNVTQLTYDVTIGGNGTGDNSWPRWSPDGTKINFLSDRDGLGHQIYVMNADGSNQNRLTNSQGSKGIPAWSPDGKKIAFPSPGGIYVMNALGDNLTLLTNTTSFGDIAWGPKAKIVPEMTLTTTVSAFIVSPGSAVKYTYSLVNTGNVNISNIGVTDNNCSPVTFVNDANGDGPGILDPRETMQFECVTMLQTTTTNTANATGILPSGERAPVETSQITVTVSPFLGPDKSIELQVGDKSYPISYHFSNGGTINGIAVTKSVVALRINLTSQADGDLEIKIPREVSDAALFTVSSPLLLFANEEYIAEIPLTRSCEQTSFIVPVKADYRQIVLAGGIIPEFHYGNAVFIEQMKTFNEEGRNFRITMVTDSKKCDATFSKEEKKIHIDIKGRDEVNNTDYGFFAIAIPPALLDGNYSLLVDGRPSSFTPDPTGLRSDPVYYWFLTNTGQINTGYLYINYTKDATKIDILGTTAIPEFDGLVSAGLSFSLLIALVITHRVQRKFSSQL